MFVRVGYHLRPRASGKESEHMSENTLADIDHDGDGNPTFPSGLSEQAYATWRGCLLEIRASKKADQAARHYQYASGYLQALRDVHAVEQMGYRQLHAQLIAEWVGWAGSH